MAMARGARLGNLDVRADFLDVDCWVGQVGSYLCLVKRIPAMIHSVLCFFQKGQTLTLVYLLLQLITVHVSEMVRLADVLLEYLAAASWACLGNLYPFCCTYPVRFLLDYIS